MGAACLFNVPLCEYLVGCMDISFSSIRASLLMKISIYADNITQPVDDPITHRAIGTQLPGKLYLPILLRRFTFWPKINRDADTSYVCFPPLLSATFLLLLIRNFGDRRMVRVIDDLLIISNEHGLGRHGWSSSERILIFDWLRAGIMLVEFPDSPLGKSMPAHSNT